MWSRVATASRTVVRPSARSPASRIADFTWALGTIVVTSIARSRVRPTTVSGGRESFRRAWSTAPIERSGSMIRATGRRRNELSPSRTWVAASPARIPPTAGGSSRSCRSRDAVGLPEPVHARRDDPVRDRAGRRRRSRSTATPRRSIKRGRRPDVLAVARVVDPGLAVGQRGEQQRPVTDRLVAGQPGLAAQPGRRADDRGAARRRIRLRDDGR